MSVSRRVSSSVAACLLAVFAVVLPAAGQNYTPRYSGTNARVTDFSNLPASAPRRFAVVGDVARPGVYETADRRAVCSAILKAAGSQASTGGYFTTHHSLRTTYTAIFDADTAEASHGDVIVVTASPRDRKPASTDDIHVALIGLQIEPVVVRLASSERSIAGLFSRLRQPAEAAVTATVNGQRTGEPLKNGDVIRVASQLVDRAALSGCDAVLPVRSLDQNAAEPAATSAAEPITEPGPPVYAALPALEAAPLPMIEPVAIDEAPGANPLVAAAPPALVRPEPVSIQTDNAPPAAARIERASAQVSAGRPERLLAQRAEFAQRASRPPDSATPTDTSVRTLVVLLALGTLGLGVALLWLASERRLRSASRPEPLHCPAPQPAAVEEPADDLSQLIRDELAIEDEPVVLPSRIALHGQAVGQKRLIVHPPQPLAGPHFAAQQPATVTASAGKVSQSSPPAATPVNRPVQSPKDTEGLLDRVLLAMQREGRK